MYSYILYSFLVLVSVTIKGEIYIPSRTFLCEYIEPNKDSLHIYSKPKDSTKYIVNTLSSDNLDFAIMRVIEHKKDWVQISDSNWIKSKEVAFLVDSLSPYINLWDVSGYIYPDTFFLFFKGEAFCCSPFAYIYKDDKLKVKLDSLSNKTIIHVLGRSKYVTNQDTPYVPHNVIIKVKSTNFKGNVLTGWMNAEDILVLRNRNRLDFDTISSTIGFEYFEPSGKNTVINKMWLIIGNEYKPLVNNLGNDCCFSPNRNYFIANGLFSNNYRTFIFDKKGTVIFSSTKLLGVPAFGNNNIILRSPGDDTIYFFNSTNNTLKKLNVLPYVYNNLSGYAGEIEVYSIQWPYVVEIESANLFHVRYERSGMFQGCYRSKIVIDVIADTSGNIIKYWND